MNKQQLEFLLECMMDYLTVCIFYNYKKDTGHRSSLEDSIETIKKAIADYDKPEEAIE
ncbi:hypothetical protein UFOVP67_58 [uncultured Caudovirales phage]|uniref:Uncharacterized protein n=1 Tax=uncultured Caudovirales phage TaxID=2100421 RepID=A0A6J5T9E3_9CAUD|nr:hypothetical protein UFOVP67_58 [uncultured Caudovirales phage]